jgi:hypothetical protein
VPVAGFPEDRDRVLMGGDRFLEPPHIPQREAEDRLTNVDVQGWLRLNPLTLPALQAFQRALKTGP